MHTRLLSATLRGLDAIAVDVEIDLSRGLPTWSMVGLPDAAVREARDRVRSALLNAGFTFPLKHITINLAPANMRKDGAHFDLPVAIGLLMASEQLQLEDKIPMPFLAGELALDGRLRSVPGALPLAMFAKQQGYKSVILPHNNAQEAAVIEGMQILSADHILQVVGFLQGKEELAEADIINNTQELSEPQPDLDDIRGQQQARRALEIAAAGGHHLLMFGSPGVGKSMLAMRMPGILPPLNITQQLEVGRIYSISRDASRPVLSPFPPFRSPHHTASDAAMIGGGSIPRPGEVSRAHLGVLFLDELPEFRRQVLEVLRQPLEEGWVSIARAAESVRFPARFQLLAAMNPCPCGYLGHPKQRCTCSSSAVRRYQQRISGPLLDRFDLRIHIPPVELEELSNMKAGESSALVAERVAKVQEIQHERLGAVRLNAHMNPTEIERFARPNAAGHDLLQRASTRFALSARGYHRLLRVARTIADLQGLDVPDTHCIAEALRYRERMQQGE
ncbi:MAG: YifB family Mg chelatase-like AAA ATPase [Mariprofundales bacterium]